MSNTSSVLDSTNDEGFGLVEIVVAMFLLALLALSFLPLLIQGLEASATNATRATATQMVQARIELARSKPPVCSSLATDLNGIATSVADSRGVQFVTTTTLGACPTALPATVPLTVSVGRVGDSAGDAPLAEAVTLLFLPAGTP